MLIRWFVFFWVITLSIETLAVNLPSQTQIFEGQVTKPKKKQTRIYRKTKQNNRINYVSTFGIFGILLGVGVAVLGWIYTILALKIIGLLIIPLGMLVFIVGVALGSPLY